MQNARKTIATKPKLPIPFSYSPMEALSVAEVSRVDAELPPECGGMWELYFDVLGIATQCHRPHIQDRSPRGQATIERQMRAHGQPPDRRPPGGS